MNELPFLPEVNNLRISNLFVRARVLFNMGYERERISKEPPRFFLFPSSTQK